MTKLFIELGLFQRSLLLSIFYLFYNAKLLKNSAKKEVKAQRFINNIILIATDKLIKGNNQRVARLYKDVFKNWRPKY